MCSIDSLIHARMKQITSLRLQHCVAKIIGKERLVPIIRAHGRRQEKHDSVDKCRIEEDHDDSGCSDDSRDSRNSGNSGDSDLR